MSAKTQIEAIMRRVGGADLQHLPPEARANAAISKLYAEGHPLFPGKAPEGLGKSEEPEPTIDGSSHAARAKAYSDPEVTRRIARGEVSFAR